MPEKRVQDRARADAEAGKSPSVQAGEFVHEEMRHIREGEHGARSSKQAIAIGLSKARRAGVKLPAPAAGKATPAVRRKAKQDLARGRRAGSRSAGRAKPTAGALRRESRASASPKALSTQARSAAQRPGPTARKASARKTARTRQRQAR